MIYLIVVEPYDPAASSIRPLYYSTDAYVTEPGDAPANQWFDDRVQDAGNYERFLFGRGRTRGDSDVGGGDIQLINVEGDLDPLLDLAFDGRTLTIYGLESRTSAWSSRDVVFRGTMDQVEFVSRAVTIRIRDRLALIRDSIQTTSYLGTTTSGGLTVAEGGADLKDVKKPLLFGRALTIAPIVVDAYDNVFQVSSKALSGISNVRDSGVPLPATQDYPTLAALKAASIPAGRFATCLALGLMRTQARPVGTLTVDATEGATLADRSAARIVQRILSAAGTVDLGDFETLHALAPAECGFWISGVETTILSVASALLASIGAYLTVDRFGTFRVGRLDLPSGPGKVVIDETIMVGGESINRAATSDEGNGVPARSVTVRYARSYTVLSASDLKTVASDDAFRAFAAQEWRQVKVPHPLNPVLHPKGPDLVFDSCFVDEAAARAEAERLLAIYGSRRDLFRINVWADEIATVDLNDIVTLAPARFGLSAGAPARVIGMVPTFETNIVELEVWR